MKTIEKNLREEARDNYRNLSEKDKNKKREYGSSFFILIQLLTVNKISTNTNADCKNYRN